MHAWACVCKHMCMHLCVHACMCACVCMHAWVCACVRACMCACVHACACMRAYMRVNKAKPITSYLRRCPHRPPLQPGTGPGREGLGTAVLRPPARRRHGAEVCGGLWPQQLSSTGGRGGDLQAPVSGELTTDADGVGVDGVGGGVDADVHKLLPILQHAVIQNFCLTVLGEKRQVVKTLGNSV